MDGVAQRLRMRLPHSVSQRIRWLFAAFAVLVAALTALGQLPADLPVWPNKVVALASLAVIAAWAWVQYGRGRLHPAYDLVPVVAIFVAGATMVQPGNVFGLMFVLLYGRALHGSLSRVSLNAAGYFLAFEAAKAVAVGLAAVLDISFVITGLGVAFSTGIMWLLGDVVTTSERDGRRHEILGRAASRLQRASDHDEMYATAVAGALDLVAEVPDAGVMLWRGNAPAVRVEARGGSIPGDLPLDVPMAKLPAGLRAALLAGEPFHLDEATTGDIRAALGMGHGSRTCLVVPLVHGDTFSGSLVVASREPLPAALRAALARLAADVGLALDLADNALLLRQVVDNSSDAIILVDAGLSIDFASSATASVLGYDPDATRGRPLAELFDGGETDLRQVLDGAAFASAHRDPDVFSMRHADGSTRQIEVASMPLPSGRRRGWVLNLRDVTRRIDAERALGDSQERFRALAESVSEGLYRMDLWPEPRFEYVNPAMERMTGFSADEFLADPSITLRQVHPDDLDRIRVMRAAATVEWPVEVRWRHPEDGWRWHRLRETVIRNAEGRAVSTMGILSDITAQKEHAQTLERALEKERRVTEQLRDIDAMRTTFLQAVSHELRTPLTIILGYSQTLNRSIDRLDPDQRANMLARLEVNAAKLDTLLSDLLDVDRLSSGTIEPARRPVDVGAVCRRVIDQLPASSHPVSGPTAVVVVAVDAPKVERIVVNLLGNAMKYTDPGTPISVEVAPDDAGSGAVITVEDRGPGVPADVRDSIFEPFVQGPGSSSSPQPGTGIGLSLVARFAELHGGRAWLETPDEGGARFRVWLPAGAIAAHGGESEPSLAHA